MRVGSRRNYKHWVTAAARTVENLSSLHDDDEVGGGDDDDNDDDVGGGDVDEPPGHETSLEERRMRMKIANIVTGYKFGAVHFL